jgi:predicted nucleic acid-binding protein
MRTVLADTSFYVAALNPEDSLHQVACARGQETGLTVIVTEFVLVELGNFLAEGQQRQQLGTLVQYLRNNPHTTVVPVSTALFDSGLDLFTHRPDKSWSLTDCISFRVMEDYGLTEALTADHHFEQAGFKTLLK